MAYTTDRTWVTGEVVTASYMNTYLRDNLKWLSTDKPMARSYKAANFTHNSTGNWIAVTQDSERFDNATMHDTSSNTERMTIPSGGGGKYLVGANCAWAPNGTGSRGLSCGFGSVVGNFICSEFHFSV